MHLDLESSIELFFCKSGLVSVLVLSLVWRCPANVAFQLSSVLDLHWRGVGPLAPGMAQAYRSCRFTLGGRGLKLRLKKYRAQPWWSAHFKKVFRISEEQLNVASRVPLGSGIDPVPRRQILYPIDFLVPGNVSWRGGAVAGTFPCLPFPTQAHWNDSALYFHGSLRFQVPFKVCEHELQVLCHWTHIPPGNMYEAWELVVSLHLYASRLSRTPLTITSFFLQMAYGNTEIWLPGNKLQPLNSAWFDLGFFPSWSLFGNRVFFSLFVSLFLSQSLKEGLTVQERMKLFEAKDSKKIWALQIGTLPQPPPFHSSDPLGRLAPARQSFHSHAYIYIEKI